MKKKKNPTARSKGMFVQLPQYVEDGIRKAAAKAGRSLVKQIVFMYQNQRKK